MIDQKFQIGIALNKSFYWSKTFGDLIELEEAEPELVIDKAIQLTSNLIDGFKKTVKPIFLESISLNGLIQFGGESLFLYNDEEMINLIKDISERNYKKDYKIYPFIHIQNDAWPEKNYFYKIIEENFKRAIKFKDKAIVVHFNAKDADNSKNIFEKTIESLTNEKYIDLVEKYKIKVCFENNHHMSFFGFPENIIRFYEILDEKLIESGKKDLIPYFSFCFDIGHFFTQMMKSGRNVKSELKYFFDIFMDRIGAFHLHTNSGKWDDHLLPLEYSDLLIENKEVKYNPMQTQNHTKLLWEILGYWNKKLKSTDEEKYLIFEIDHPYTINQIYELGEKLGISLS
jgi:sugar phosphate isomerase/epimerase